MIQMVSLNIVQVHDLVLHGAKFWPNFVGQKIIDLEKNANNRF